MKISHYEFGKILVNGKEYTKDIVIKNNKVTLRKTENRHAVTHDEIDKLIREEPDIIIIGLGNNSVAKIEESAREHIAESKIELFTADTPKAVERFNESEGKNIAAIFHLTC